MTPGFNSNNLTSIPTCWLTRLSLHAKILHIFDRVLKVLPSKKVAIATISIDAYDRRLWDFVSRGCAGYKTLYEAIDRQPFAEFKFSAAT